MSISSTLRQRITDTALAAGFDLAGIAPVPPDDSELGILQSQRFLDWAARGHAGDMAWMLRADENGVPLRSSLTKAVPWAKSVILCALNYNADQPRSTDPAPAGTGWIARYAWSGSNGVPTDYHNTMLQRLRAVEAHLQASLPDVQARCYVDTGPVVERWLAQLAGIGWIGKNTCVLNQGQGSYLLLGVILVSASLDDEAVLLPASDRCGSCTRCIDACPTDALIAPRQMDASRCIAYLTIEKKGDIDPALAAAMGRQVFGCDICQDVCPWNRRAPIGTAANMQPRAELVNPHLEELAALDAPAFKRLFKGSPLERTGRRRLQRNVAVAMGNSGDAEHRPTLKQWAGGEDELLAVAAQRALRQLDEFAGSPLLASSEPPQEPTV